MGAVFGTSSILGPVLGGWLADGPGWEWIFWLNVPIGAVALVVTSYALKLPHVRRDHVIDWWGAVLNTRLAHHLSEGLGSGSAPSVNTNDTSAIQSLPEPVRSTVTDAFSSSLHDVFITALPVVAVAFLISLFINGIPLRGRDTPVAAEATEL